LEQTQSGAKSKNGINLIMEQTQSGAKSKNGIKLILEQIQLGATLTLILLDFTHTPSYKESLLQN